MNQTGIMRDSSTLCIVVSFVSCKQSIEARIHLNRLWSDSVVRPPSGKADDRHLVSISYRKKGTHKSVPEPRDLDERVLYGLNYRGKEDEIPLSVIVDVEFVKAGDIPAD